MSERIYRATDAEENERVALPSGVQVKWPCFWMAELYAPSHATALVRGLAELEQATSSFLGHTEEPSDWLRRARSWSGGFWKVGHFVGDRDARERRQKVGLPRHFKSMHAELRQIAPGITVLLMQFVLADDASASLEKIMKSTFTTQLTPIKGRPGGENIRGPEHRKQDEIKLVRATYRGAARDWILERVPGLFSGLPAAEAPSWDLLLSSDRQLYEDEPNYEERWRECLGFGHPLDQWHAASLPALRLLRARSNQAGARPALVGLEGEALAMLEGEHMGSDISGLLHLVDQRVSDQLALWTLLRGLNAHEDQFTAIRDSLAAPPVWWQSGARLRRLRGEVMPLAFDLETLGKAAMEDRVLAPWARRSASEFTLALPEGERPGPRAAASLLAFIGERITERGESIVSEGRDVSAALRSQGELLLAASNARLQWLVLALTLVVGAAGIVASLKG